MSCQCKTDKQRAKCIWWVGPESGFVQKNDATGETRIATGCFPDLVLDVLRYVVKSGNGTQAAVESTRNVIASGFVHIAECMPRLAPPADLKMIDAAPPE